MTKPELPFSQDLEKQFSRLKSQWGQQSKKEAALTEVMVRKRMGELARFAGMTHEPPIPIPQDILILSVERGIPNEETSYFTTPEGTIIDTNGQPILPRNDPTRIEKERLGVTEYLYNQEDEENYLLYDVLQDPNSDTREEKNLAGVTHIHARRLRPMDLDCRVAVVIPAHYEEDRITTVLKGFAKQEGITQQQYEINVLVNHREDQKPDKTTQRILEFKQKHPMVPINLLDVTFNKSHATVGYARKLMTDLALVRAVKRPGYYSPLYIISADADETKVDPTIVAKTIAGFDQNPSIDCLRGRQDRSNALISQNYLCALTYKSNQFVEYILRDKRLRDPFRKGYNFDWNRVVSGGWACAFTAESYAIINGYVPLPVGEDVTLGQLCSLARGHWTIAGNLIPFLEVTKTMRVKGESNFLRLGQEIISGISAYEEKVFYNDQIKQKSEKEVLRILKPYARIDPQNPDNIARFENAVQNGFAFLRGCIGDDGQFPVFAKRYLLFLGFRTGDYQILNTNGKPDLTITSWHNVIAALERNKDKYKDIFAQKYQNT